MLSTEEGTPMFTDEKLQTFEKQCRELIQTMKTLNTNPRYTEERSNQLLNQCLSLHQTVTSIQVTEWQQG
jgi:hypothetical protein